MRIPTLLLPLLAAGILAPAVSLAQQPVMIPINAKNNGSGTDAADRTVTIGLHPDATYGIDAALGEEEQPPLPPSGVMDLRAVDLSNRPKEFGEGLAVDMRDYVSSEQIDTFRLRLQVGDGGFPVTFTWPENLNANIMTIRPTGGEPVDPVNMLTTTSLVVSDPDVNTVVIIRNSDKAAGAEGESEPLGELMLTTSSNPVVRQNGTIVSYRLGHTANVSLKLYDLLGRLVQTNVDERQSAAVHSVRIDTQELSAGTYYFTLVVDGIVETQRLIVLD